MAKGENKTIASFDKWFAIAGKDKEKVIPVSAFMGYFLDIHKIPDVCLALSFLSLPLSLTHIIPPSLLSHSSPSSFSFSSRSSLSFSALCLSLTLHS